MGLGSPCAAASTRRIDDGKRKRASKRLSDYKKSERTRFVQLNLDIEGSGAEETVVSKFGIEPEVARMAIAVGKDPSLTILDLSFSLLPKLAFAELYESQLPRRTIGPARPVRAGTSL